MTTGANDTWICPQSRFEYPHPTSGEILEGYRGRCRRNRCLPCARWKLDRFQRAIGRVKPATFLTIAGLALTPAQIHSARPQFRKAIRKSAGPNYADLWVIEPHADRRLHVHILVVPNITTERALAAATTAGLGSNVDVRRVTHYPGLSYVVKRAGDPETHFSHLRLNGGRFASPTRNFWAPNRGQPVRGGFMTLGAPWWRS